MSTKQTAALSDNATRVLTYLGYRESDSAIALSKDIAAALSMTPAAQYAACVELEKIGKVAWFAAHPRSTKPGGWAAVA